MRITLVTILGLILCLISCQGNEEEIIGGNSLNNIILIYPVEEEVKPNRLRFEWESNHDEVTFQLYDKEQELILDSVLSSNELILSQKLYPEAEYTWKIMVANEVKEAVFTTTDILSYYSGIYNVIGERSCWGLTENCDTIIETQIEVIKNGEEVIIRESFTGMNKSNWLLIYIGGEDAFFYHNYTPFSSSINFNLSNDSLSVGYCQCGRGGGANWGFKGVKE